MSLDSFNNLFILVSDEPNRRHQFGTTYTSLSSQTHFCDDPCDVHSRAASHTFHSISVSVALMKLRCNSCYGMSIVDNFQLCSKNEQNTTRTHAKRNIFLLTFFIIFCLAMLMFGFQLNVSCYQHTIRAQYIGSGCKQRTRAPFDKSIFHIRVAPFPFSPFPNRFQWVSFPWWGNCYSHIHHLPLSIVRDFRVNGQHLCACSLIWIMVIRLSACCLLFFIVKSVIEVIWWRTANSHRS